MLEPFADPSVYFLLGGMFIGRAMTRHGLDRRIALSIVCTRWAGRTPATVLLGVGLSRGAGLDVDQQHGGHGHDLPGDDGHHRRAGRSQAARTTGSSPARPTPRRCC